MKRELVFSLSVLAAALVPASACDDGIESACEVDTDCPQGTICREQRCGPVGADGGAPDLTDAGPVTCTSEGLSCVQPDECCSGVCTSGSCEAIAPVPTTPECRGLYELCQNDCCSGLTCTEGTCR